MKCPHCHKKVRIKRYCEIGIGNDGKPFSCSYTPCNLCEHYVTEIVKEE